MNYTRKGQSHSQAGSSEAHTQLIIDTMVFLGKEASSLCRLWRNETGMGLNIRTGTPFKYGLEGSPDLIGICKGGFILGLECKTGGAKQSVAQRNFEEMIKNFNGHYYVIRSKEEALEIVRNICRV